MSEQVARYNPGENVPGFAAAVVNAGRFVKVSATKNANGAYPVEHAAVKTRPFGVAQQDSGPTSQDEHAVERMINVIRRGAIARVQSGAAITAGEEVEVGANGKAVKLAEGIAVGRCLVTVGAADVFTEIDLY
jgi:hypothetical protein